MPRLWPHLRRAARQPPRRLSAGDALGRDSARLGLPGLRGPRQAGLRETRALKAVGLAAAALALLAGCHAIKLTYNRLDWLAEWQLGKFVDLAPPQKDLFDDRFANFWGWHRRTQLELYVRDIRDIAQATARPLTTAQVEAYMNRGTEHMARALQGAVPDTAAVLRSLDDAQVRELLDNLAERREDSREESADLTTEELRERAEESMLKQLKRWIGSPTRDQKRRVKDWAAERQYAGTIWHQYQEAWATAFTEVLKHRRQPDFEQRLSKFFDGGRVPFKEEMEKVQAHNRQLLIGLLADLSAMLTAEQRTHLRLRAEELASDLEELARERNGETSDAGGARAQIIG